MDGCSMRNALSFYWTSLKSSYAAKSKQEIYTASDSRKAGNINYVQYLRRHLQETPPKTPCPRSSRPKHKTHGPRRRILQRKWRLHASTPLIGLRSSLADQLVLGQHTDAARRTINLRVHPLTLHCERFNETSSFTSSKTRLQSTLPSSAKARKRQLWAIFGGGTARKFLVQSH